MFKAANMSNENISKWSIIYPFPPCYLHPSEGSNILVTAVIFNGRNYDLWEEAWTTALKAKNKLRPMDDSLAKLVVKEDDTSEVQAWEMVK